MRGVESPQAFDITMHVQIIKELFLPENTTAGEEAHFLAMVEALLKRLVHANGVDILCKVHPDFVSPILLEILAILLKEPEYSEDMRLLATQVLYQLCEYPQFCDPIRGLFLANPAAHPFTSLWLDIKLNLSDRCAVKANILTLLNDVDSSFVKTGVILLHLSHDREDVQGILGEIDHPLSKYIQAVVQSFAESVAFFWEDPVRNILGCFMQKINQKSVDAVIWKNQEYDSDIFDQFSAAMSVAAPEKGWGRLEDVFLTEDYAQPFFQLFRSKVFLHQLVYRQQVRLQERHGVVGAFSGMKSSAGEAALGAVLG